MVIDGKSAGFGTGSVLGSGGSEMVSAGSGQVTPVAQKQLGFGSRMRRKTPAWSSSSRLSNHQGRNPAGFGWRGRKKGGNYRNYKEKRLKMDTGLLRGS